MRLRRLAMAFVGPYAGVAEIDFDSLGDVFLVCGKTGSGKTTIFEAIAYALYGQSRSQRDIVSQFAGPDDESYVLLEFDVGRERWRVTRKPARTVAKRRGEGTTERPSEVLLETRDGAVWKAVADKASDAQRLVEQAIGLSADEFTKIVLLPQGEFQRFLEMNTGDRTPILEKLFPVDGHAAVSDLAATKARDAEATARSIDERVRAIESRLGDDPDAELAAARAEAEEARRDEALAAAALDSAKAKAREAESAAKAWAEFDDAAAEAAALESGSAEAASLAARLERAEAALSARPAVEAARRCREASAEASAASAKAASELAALDARTQEIQSAKADAASCQAELSAIEGELGRLASRAEAWKRASLAAGDSSQARVSVERAGVEAVAASERLAEALAALAALEAAKPDADALELERSASREALDDARTASRLAAEADARRSAVAALQARAAALRSDSERDDLALSAAEGISSETAGALESAKAEAFSERLAASLAPGMPCPVCGSTEHPHPAAQRPVEAEPSIASLEAAAAKAAEASAAARERAAAAKARMSELESRLEAERRSLEPIETASSAEAAKEALAAAEKRAAALAERIAAESAREKLERDARAATARLRTALDEAKAEEAAAAARWASASAAEAEALKSAGDRDPGPEISALELRRAAAAAAAALALGKVTEWERARSGAMAKASETARRADSAGHEDSDAEASALNALADAGFADEDAWDAASLAVAELAAARLAVRARADAETRSKARMDAAGRAIYGAERPDAAGAAIVLAETERAYAGSRTALDAAVRAEHGLALELESLRAERTAREAHGEKVRRLVAMARLLNGDTDGRRLSFKNFALASYFSAVVDKATIRLREMSSERYELRAAEGRSLGRGRVGLDLEVLDSYTGRARPAASLSGGEKFLASISLALGLSDVIVSRSGGVSLDSIFIDEGFGSLDDETLDKAIAALDRVRGDRVIGVVSHVGELKARFPARIDVKKAPRGSTISIVS